MRAKVVVFALTIIGMVLFATFTNAAGVNTGTGDKVNVNDSKLNISGDVTNAGTLQTSTGTISLDGNWTNNLGTFNAGDSGTVAFTGSGASTIIGVNTFANFICAQSGKQLSFEAGKTQTISSTWTLTGASGNLIKLRSTGTGTQWKIDPKVTRNVSYVDVKDSNNISSTSINPTNSTDSGNNTNWFPVAATPTPTPSGSDTTAPTNVSVVIESGALYVNKTTVTLALSATDNVGVTAYYLSTSSSTPVATASGWNSVTSATSYSGSTSYTLASGDGPKTVYAWYKDAAGNVSSSASDSITLDTTAPIVTITSPTSDPYTATSSTVSLEGSASDSTSGVKEATWTNSSGGSGTVTGTTSWTISSISLSSGDNIITVTAKDNAGNTATDTITVKYTSGPIITPTPTASPLPTPVASPSPVPTLPPLPTPQVSPSPIQEGIVFGFVNDEDELPLEGATITITGKDSSESTETDENGYYEFRGLGAGEYAITYEKEGFLAQTQDISLEEGEVKDLGVVILEQIERGKIYGYVVNIKGNPLEFVRLRLKGVKTKVIKTASSDADGFFEFTDLEADTYVIIAKKKKYRNTQQKVKLEEGASEEIEIVMKKTSKRIKGLLLEEDVQ